jgi:G3E family GTPase
MASFLPPDSGDRIPVSLLTGFLGSGKTTLLNRLLQQPEMARTAIVINEFGDVGLDQLFVESSDGEVTVLANGCLCCDVQEDFKGVMGTLFARRGRGDIPAFDRLVIEMSGLADPGPVMQMILNQPLITENFRLDTVLATVDAIHARRQLQENPEAVNQIALSDRLVVTKTDFPEAGEPGALIDLLKSLNPSASILEAAQWDAGPGAFFGADHTRWDPRPAKHSHRHSLGIDSFSLLIDEPVEWHSFSAWLNALKIRYADQLLRVKGLVYVAGEDLPVAIHGVHHVFHPPMRVRRSEADRVGRLVFTTRGLPRETVEASWRQR